MSRAAPHSPRILAATADNCTLIVVSGAATFKLAPAFKQALQAAKLAGSPLVVVDMADCVSMDSTFMGALATAGLAQRTSDCRLALLNPTPHARSLLRGLGVDRLLKSYSAAELPAGLADLSGLKQNLRPVEAAPVSQRDMAALMYDAHETLTRVDPENLQRFKDVLAFLREDLQRF